VQHVEGLVRGVGHLWKCLRVNGHWLLQLRQTVRATLTVRRTSNYWRREKFVAAAGKPPSPLSPMLLLLLLLLLLVVVRSATDDVV